MLSVLRVYNNTKLFNLLEPTAEQANAIVAQEGKVIHLEMFDEMEFYGDLFPSDKVPLNSSDLKNLLYEWMRNVFIDTNRIKKSHKVLEKHLDKEKILEFYKSVFDKPKFNEKALKRLLKS